MLIGYARVSTADQSPNLQTDALKAAGCERIFQEARSGASEDRPELAKALAYLRAEDTLVVWRFDRLARSLRQLITTMEDLSRREIGLRSITEAIDTTTPGGKLVFHIFGALAEFERGVIRERTHAGLAATRARGRNGGRKPKLATADLATIRLLLEQTDRPFEDIARQFKVSVATLSRRFPGGRLRYQTTERVVHNDCQ